MGSYKLKVGAREEVVEVLGLNSLTLAFTKNEDQVFLRPKISGSLIFHNKSYELIKKLREQCCGKEVFKILRSCNDTILTSGKLLSKNSNWDNEIGQVTIEPTTFDLYGIVLQNFNKQINVLELPATKWLNQNLRLVCENDDIQLKKDLITQKGGRFISQHYESESTTSIWYSIQNKRGRFLTEVVLYIIKKSLENTPANDLIPSNIQQLSYFMTSDINICTGEQNRIKSALVFQASDYVDPISTNSASGILESGKVNEDMALSLKEILDELNVAFDIVWFIDKNTGKLRLEHSSYIENGGSYSTKEIGLDLTQAKYQDLFRNYKYSFRTNIESDTKIEEFKFSLNESLNKNKKSYKAPLSHTNTLYGFSTKGFLNCIDFEIGNINYGDDCLSESEDGTENRKEIKTCNLFYTNLEGLSFNDGIELDKWVLVDAERQSNVGFGNELYEIVFARVEMLNISQELANANFSASSLVRNYHRWGKRQPFAYYNFNENAPIGTIASSGVLRPSYSVERNKELKSFKIPFCCTDDGLDTSKLIAMPNGLIASIKSCNFDFATEQLELNVMADSNCLNTITYPNGGGGSGNTSGCSQAGTYLRTEVYNVTKTLIADPCVNIGRPEAYEDVTLVSKKYFYADGFCGEYFVEAKLPISAVYWNMSVMGNFITAQAYCDLTEEEKNIYTPYLSCEQ